MPQKCEGLPRLFCSWENSHESKSGVHMSYTPSDACCQRCQERPCICGTGGASQNAQGWWTGGGMNFDGHPIKVLEGATGRNARFEFLYGGFREPDGPGHGHVVSNDGENIHYWRLPSNEGGRVMIDDRQSSSEKLGRHGL